ncbi:unnamed protein product [Durusdinium trenchii]|uniref:Uncharacterized protein n=1 Tax=Durusdinium trenchii TaxID=1381693 RepID=A0ABP0PVV8_9DINO
MSCQWPIYPSYDWAHGLSDAIEAPGLRRPPAFQAQQSTAQWEAARVRPTGDDEYRRFDA